MKNCEICGNSFEVSLYHPDQKHCTNKCSQKASRLKAVADGRRVEQRKRYLEKHGDKKRAHDLVLHNQRAFGGLKYQVLARDGNKCTTCKCADMKRLIIHHKDENKQNNVMENLTTLCRACHARVHHTGSDNVKYKDISKDNIAEAIESTSTLDEAAKKLGITRKTLAKKRKDFGFAPMRNDTKGEW